MYINVDGKLYRCIEVSDFQNDSVCEHTSMFKPNIVRTKPTIEINFFRDLDPVITPDGSKDSARPPQDSNSGDGHIPSSGSDGIIKSSQQEPKTPESVKNIVINFINTGI